MANVHASSVVDRGFIGGVMVSVHASSVIDRGFVGFSLGWVKPKTYTIGFVASPLSMQHKGVRAKTGWLGIRIMCPSRASCLPTDCCFSEPAL